MPFMPLDDARALLTAALSLQTGRELLQMTKYRQIDLKNASETQVVFAARALKAEFDRRYPRP